MQISVEFDDSKYQIPDRYVSGALLKRMMEAFRQGFFQFVSFEGWPHRVQSINHLEKCLAAIKVRALKPEDNFPEHWKPGSPLRLGTFSSERTGIGHSMRLGPNAAGVEAIMDALEYHRPDVLLTAGYSLRHKGDLEKLNALLQTSNWDGLLFVEVADYDIDDPPSDIRLDSDLSSHCLFAWTRNGGWKRMGRQYFVTSAAAKRQRATNVAAFERNLPQRVIDFRGRRFGVLICGEINALQGRNDVTALTPEIESWLRGLDVIVNPTHDLMGNAGTLIAKRKWVSKDRRVYASASNWNTGNVRRQRRTAATLHTVFIDGQSHRAFSV